MPRLRKRLDERREGCWRLRCERPRSRRCSGRAEEVDKARQRRVSDENAPTRRLGTRLPELGRLLYEQEEVSE